MGSRDTVKNDLILAAVVLAAALILFGVLRSGTARSGSGFASVSVGGEIVKRLPLDVDTEYLITTEYGENLLCIRSGECAVTDADCPDRVCVKAGSVKRPGECIVCVPHRVVVTIEGSGEIDAVSE